MKERVCVVFVVLWIVWVNVKVGVVGKRRVNMGMIGVSFVDDLEMGLGDGFI